MPTKPHMIEWISVRILYLPTYINGRLNKGAMILSEIDLVLDRFPRLKKLFFIAERRGWCGINPSRHADIKLVEDLSTFGKTQRWFPHAIVLPAGTGDFVDHDVFKPLDLACKYHGIQISCWRRFKRHELFIRAASLLPELEFLHLGLFVDGGAPDELQYRDACLSLADQIAPNIDFPFRNVDSNAGMPNDPHEINGWINQAKIGIFTSSTEGLPRFKMECLAADRPFLVADDAAYPVKLYIDQATGAFFAPDPQSLAGAIRQMLASHGSYTPRASLLSITGKARSLALLKDALKRLCKKHGQVFTGQDFSWDGRNENLLWGEKALAHISQIVDAYPSRKLLPSITGFLRTRLGSHKS